jgi:nitrite reductase (NADH) large subunit
VRVGQHRSFESLLAAHGQGLGCDVCKPAAASILASCWNDFVLKPELAALQDSNDYYLGNIGPVADAGPEQGSGAVR